MWIVMVAFGWAALYSMRWTTKPFLDMLLVRVAAAAFAGAGVLGADGWIGEWINQVVTWAIGLADQFGAYALGTAVTWLVVAAVAGMWIGAMAPRKLFTLELDERLVFSGFFLPNLLTSVPGQLGIALSAVILPIAEVSNDWLLGLIR